MDSWGRNFGGWRGAFAIAAAIAILGLVSVWYGDARVQPVPDRPLRIGFENNPPVQVRDENGFSGLAVETVNDAARRAGIQLQWVETGTSSDEAFRRGLVDLWPLMVDLPERRKFIHFARPWMHAGNVLVVREGTPNPDRGFKGRISVFRMPLHIRLLQSRFPGANVVVTATTPRALSLVCTGGVAAAFLEGRAAQTELRERPPECASVDLRVLTIPDLVYNAGVASSFAAAGAADRIQREIDNMFRDGTLAVLIAKYSYFGLDDTWASYERVESEKQLRLLTLLGCGVLLVVGVMLWQASSLRQRKRAEERLRESEGRFRALANHAPVMIVASDALGNATFFNRTWLDFTGRSMEQELGCGWLENVHPEDRDHTLKQYGQSLAARGSCKIEYRLRRADGEYRHVMCSGVPRFEPRGAFAGYIASCIDLTDIKHAEEEARERHNLESLGVLAGGIAHDFNNLLGGALAYSELGLTKVAEGEAPDDELRQICTVAMRGAEIVRQLMIFAGNETGVLEPLDVSALVSDMLELLKVSISKHAVLETSLDQNLPAVRGNSAQIRQVVMNLVTNASEAIGDRGGVIRVISDRVTLEPGSSVREWKNLPAGEYLRLEVSDTGCGMTPETQRRLFEPFFTTKFAGRGMGLAVVQRIVRQLGGAIQVVSLLDQGTSIRILLPCAAEAASTIEPDSSENLFRAASQKHFEEDRERTVISRHSP
jgi:PAS domain S-box-containing protein